MPVCSFEALTRTCFWLVVLCQGSCWCFPGATSQHVCWLHEQLFPTHKPQPPATSLSANTFDCKLPLQLRTPSPAITATHRQHPVKAHCAEVRWGGMVGEAPCVATQQCTNNRTNMYTHASLRCLWYTSRRSLGWSIDIHSSRNCTAAATFATGCSQSPKRAI